MNVREAANFLSNAKELYIAWDGCCIPFNPRSSLEMDAFSDYKVHKILQACEMNTFEIELEIHPVKEH